MSCGRIEVAEVIRALPWEAKTMPIGELLRSQKRWGEGRCRRFLGPTLILETKRLDSLTERQRGELVSRLGAPVPTGSPLRRPEATTQVPPRESRCARRRRRQPAAGAGPGKPGPCVAISTMWPSGSRR